MLFSTCMQHFFMVGNFKKKKSKLIRFIMACDIYSLGLTSGGPVSVMCCSLLGTLKIG